MIAAVACLVAALQTNVSLEIKAERLERAAPAIGRALGLEPLTVSPVLRDEVLAFRCTGVRAAEAQSKIELVLNASFVKTKEGWSLEQTPEQRAADILRQKNYAHDVYAKLVERCKFQLAKNGPFDANAAATLQQDLKQLASREVAHTDDTFYSRVRKVGLQSPLSKFALRFIGRLQAKDWMPLSRTRPKIVYSLNPTKMQSPLPFSIKDLTEQLIKDQALWVDSYGDTPITGPRIREIDGRLSDTFSLGEANESRRKFDANAFSHVICTLWWNNDFISVATYNSAGIQSSNTNFSLVDFDEDLSTNPPVDSQAKLFEYSEEMNLFNAAFRGDRTRNMNAKLPQSLIDKLLQPLTCDPLSICAYPQLAHSAKTKNFAHVLGDELIGEKGVSFTKIAEDRDKLELIESDNWIVVRKNNPLEARFDRADRRVATRLFQMVKSRGRDLSIEERAHFIASLPVMRESDGYMHQVGTLLGKVGVRSYRDPASHRIYGILSSSEQKAIARSPAPIRSLSPAALEVLNFEVFLRPFGISPQTVELDTSKMAPAEREQYNNFAFLMDAGLYYQESFLLPNGLTGAETLSSTETNNVSLICGAPPGVVDGVGRVMTPESMGRYLAQREFNEVGFSLNGIFEPDINAIWLANRRSITLKLRLHKYVEVIWTIGDIALTASEKTRLEDLPDPIAKRIEEAKVKTRAEFQRVRSVRPIDKSNPPPL